MKNPTTKAGRPFELKITRFVPPVTVSDTLISAFEGGVGYWCQIDNEKGPDYRAGTCAEIVAGRAYLLLTDTETGKQHRLDRAAIQRGLKVMAELQPDHFRDMTSEDTSGDATTGDVLLQCCLLGEVYYG